MAFEIPLNEVDPDNVGGYDNVAAGYYNCIVTNVDEEGGKKGEMIVDLEIVRGTTAGQDGKSHRLFFVRSSQAFHVKKMLALAIAARLTTAEELKAMKAAGQSPKFDFPSAKGANIVVHLVVEEYPEGSGKFSTKLAWDEIFRPEDKRVRHVPLHAGFLQRCGITLPADRPVDGIRATGPAGGGTGTAKPTAANAAPPPSSQAVNDVLAGIV